LQDNRLTRFTRGRPTPGFRPVWGYVWGYWPRTRLE
jgi:hypothetical protein